MLLTLKQAQADWEKMPNSIPILLASLKDVGPLGTFFLLGGGKQAKIAIDFLDWKVKGDQSKKSLFCGSSSNSTKPGSQRRRDVEESPLTAEGWNILTKNGMC
jgi:hypothetical protein